MTSIRFPLEVDTELGRFREEPDRDRYIRQLMLQVLLTTPGERVNRPDFGCGVRAMVFAPNSPAGAALAEVLVHQALTRWVGDLIAIERIATTAEEATLSIEINYRPRHRRDTQVLNVDLPQ